MSISLSSPSGSGEEDQSSMVTVITSPTLTSLSLLSSDDEFKDINKFDDKLSQTINYKNRKDEKNEKNEVLLPLMTINNKHNVRPNSILKKNAHKRSCSTGQQITVPLDSSSSQQLSKNVCNCRTKSVQILTPSQEKDESDLWPNIDNKVKSFSTKYCAKCDKLLINDSDFKLNNKSEDNNYLSNYCFDCDFDNNETNINTNSSANNSQYSHQNNTSDNMSLYSIHMEKDFRYYFQHPYARLFVAYFVVFCNFLIFAEDPLSHSIMECSIPVIGNVISFIATKYPPEWPWIVFKVCLWVTALFVGLVFGKYVLHHIILRRVLRLKMFRDECGTWMIILLSVFISSYFFSIVYNFILVSSHPYAHLYVINTYMGMSYANFMKVAACGTWLGDFFTAWMITDMMLQDNLYPGWASNLRFFWHKHSTIRIFVFWSGAIVIAILVISLIVTDKISWDHLNKDFVASTELSRAFLASSILCMDLLIVMQDWDFPHFVCDLNIKLPGLLQSSYEFQFFKKSLKFPDMVFYISAIALYFLCVSVFVHFVSKELFINKDEVLSAGKWFNYGFIIGVMMLDLNMWKNQIIYFPPDYGQYVDPKYHKVYTITDESLLGTGNRSLWDYSTRASNINPLTNKTFIESDLVINSRYLGYPAFIKGMAFLPIAAGFILFFTLIYQYGRFPPKTDVSVGGRLKKRHSSWRRERRDSRLGGYISWRGITIYGGNNAMQRKNEF